MLSKNRDIDNIILHKLDDSSLEEIRKVNKYFKNIYDNDKLGKYLGNDVDKYKFTDTWKEFYNIMKNFELENRSYNSFYEIIEDYYEKFLDNVYGDLKKFLSIEYKKLYIKIIHGAYIEISLLNDDIPMFWFEENIYPYVDLIPLLVNDDDDDDIYNLFKVRADKNFYEVLKKLIPKLSNKINL